MHLVFYGPEGSGKGTQAKLLAEKLNLPVITTGDLVREAAANNKTRIGNLARKALTEGKYLPDEAVSSLIENKLKSSDVKPGFVLDGYPRTAGQAQFLNEAVKEAGYGLDKFIYLALSDKQAIIRLSKRKRALFSGSKTLHDDPQRVRERLKTYRKEEKQVLRFYKDRSLLLEIDADKDIEEVFNDIKRGLGLS